MGCIRHYFGWVEVSGALVWINEVGWKIFWVVEVVGGEWPCGGVGALFDNAQHKETDL